MVTEDIDTVIDRLYEFVQAGQESNIKDAALALSLSEEQVEKLSVILEEAGLIEIRYTLSGAFIKAKKPVSYLAPLPFEAPRKKAEGEKLVEGVKGVEGVAEFIELDFLDRLAKVQKSLSDLESKKDLDKAQLALLKKEMAALHDRLKKFQDSVKKIQAGESTFEQKLSIYEKQIEVLEKAKASELAKPKPQASVTNLITFLIAFIHSLIESLKLQKPGAKPAEAKPGEKKTLPHLTPSPKTSSFFSKSQKKTEAEKPAPKPVAAKSKPEKTEKRIAKHSPVKKKAVTHHVAKRHAARKKVRSPKKRGKK